MPQYLRERSVNNVKIKTPPRRNNNKYISWEKRTETETMMGEPEVKRMKSDDENGDEEMTVQFEDENGEGMNGNRKLVQSWSSHDRMGLPKRHGVIVAV